MTWVPDACTLPTEERPLRVAEFDELFRRAVVRVERAGPTRAVLTLTGTEDVRETLEDLAAREAACCSFFTFEVTTGAEGVRFVVDVPSAHAAVLDALVSRAAAASPSAVRATRFAARPPRDGEPRPPSPWG